ncbi:hypothetical protein [Sorangium sp. So ce1182]|uniref:hypothetical protein n=1 Tax=Sorangium sp. So ce1182 TaxID=3133334 RepID=UPI003F6177F0
MQKKRKVLRAPFIVTVAAAAASLAGAVALPGCDPTVQGGSCPEELPERGSSCEADDLSCDYIDSCDNPIGYGCVDGAWQVESEMSCNPPPPPECPAELPATGSACWQIGAGCAYGGPPDCPDPTIVTCGEDGTWSVTVAVSCNPPPPACPEELPADGDPCEAGLGTCGFMMPTGCGPLPVNGECVLQGDTWRWQVHELFCNPPPPEECLRAATADACASLGPTCQWLVPGCADEPGPPALAAVGCFPSLPCETDKACPAGTLCQEVVVNPCVASSPDGVTCAACGEYKNVCVPPSAATTSG